MRHLAIVMLSTLPVAAFGAGSQDTAPPTPTETTTECKEGEVWDEKTKLCTAPEDARLNDDIRFQAARELAYAGRPDDALRVLATMREGNSDRVLTYLGFANRKAGRLEDGLAYYAQALAANPDNILARSYLGQAYVDMGETELAMAELIQIRNRGGSDSWAAAALSEALVTGHTRSY